MDYEAYLERHLNEDVMTKPQYRKFRKEFSFFDRLDKKLSDLQQYNFYAQE